MSAQDIFLLVFSLAADKFDSSLANLNTWVDKLKHAKENTADASVKVLLVGTHLDVIEPGGEHVRGSKVQEKMEQLATIPSVTVLGYCKFGESPAKCM